MDVAGAGGGEASSGLSCLALLLRFHGIAVDPAQVAHRFGSAIGVTEMLRCARELKLKSRLIATDWQRLAKLSLPAIAECRDGAFVILGKAMPDRVMVQDPAAGRPQLLGREEFEARWTGRLVLIARRAALGNLARTFDVSWFLQAMHKFRRLFAEVLLASFFLQLFALATPLFFQVVTDKVLTHRGFTTLDVLVVGLIAVSTFEVVLGALRTHVFAHTTNRIDVESQYDIWGTY